MAISLKRKFDPLSQVLFFLALSFSPVKAAAIEVKPLADNSWIVMGVEEEIHPDNQGRISNIAFISTGKGVVLIDSGISHHFGRDLREKINAVSGEDVRWVINTHHHPDHVFGNSAFSDVKILSLPATRESLKRDGPHFSDSLSQRLGSLVEENKLVLPNVTVAEGALDLDGYLLNLYAFRGHSGSDLVVFDPHSRVLYSGDMVFWNRAPTTPHSPGLNIWIDELDALSKIDYAVLVPGHGEVTTDARAIDQTREWLVWLDRLMLEAVEKGRSANSLIKTPLPKMFSSISLAHYELTRSVSHWFRRYEEAWWQE